MAAVHNAIETLPNEHDVARITGLSVASVRRWRLLKQGPNFLKVRVGGEVRWPATHHPPTRCHSSEPRRFQSEHERVRSGAQNPFATERRCPPYVSSLRRTSFRTYVRHSPPRSTRGVT